MVEYILCIEKCQIRGSVFRNLSDSSSGINDISFTNTKKYHKTATVSKSWQAPE